MNEKNKSERVLAFGVDHCHGTDFLCSRNTWSSPSWEQDSWRDCRAIRLTGLSKSSDPVGPALSEGKIKEKKKAAP